MEDVICRAQQILKEDEPEVRAINKVILAAKVGAIREAQLQEKDLIKWAYQIIIAFMYSF